MAEKEVSAEPTETNPPTEDMDTGTLAPPAQNPDDGADSKGVNNDDSKSKRGREEDGEGSDKVSKKQMVEKSVEEESLENTKPEPSESGRVRLGPKEFGSSVEMFDYFYNLLHYWPTQFNLNKYEHMVMLELLKKGHEESEKKIGGGIKAFQIRFHPVWKSKCFFAVREDETVEDFSFRKCVDHILPLPDEMKKPDANRGSGSSRGRGHGGKGGARGRGGKFRK
ncbi:hypothetical protein HRI_004164100 [Hibiscus trionum]|uniref:Uncharacterized protein n=1 Tax=Hibiscus trionum TaxID=183268 RepID=A0A9W7J404_HIBTR|nr:hypothetical protein HRI_004164100 [Hibiscus trionum]